jgi:chromate transport protein ChrA
MNDLKTTAAPDASVDTAPSYTLWQLVRYMLRLGTLGFGGPVALVGYMYRDLVEQRGWISDADYKEGMALAQLMPGPLAAQLAIYLGYVHFRLWGATLVGLAFVLPSFVMVVALGVAYKAYGGISWMQAVFYGVGASVIGIIALSAYKLTTKSVGKDKLLWAIYLLSAGVTIITQSEVIWVFLGAGLLVWAVRGPLKRTGGQLQSVAWAAPIAEPQPGNPRLAQAGADCCVLHLCGRLRLWQRPGHRAVSLRRCGQGVRMADRPPIRGRRGRGHDHAWPGGYHYRVHRLPDQRLLGRGRRGSGDLSALLPAHRDPCAVL